MIDLALEKYRASIKKTIQQNEQKVIIDDILEELENKRDISIPKKKQAQLKDEVSIYRLEENTLDYVLFRIRELTGRLI